MLTRRSDHKRERVLVIKDYELSSRGNSCDLFLYVFLGIKMIVVFEPQRCAIIVRIVPITAQFRWKDPLARSIMSYIGR